MAAETTVHVKLDSASLFEAVRAEVGEFRLSEHEFREGTDELRVSDDSGGSGRVGITIVFELDEAQMAQVLRIARPADRRPHGRARHGSSSVRTQVALRNSGYQRRRLAMRIRARPSE